MANLEKYFKKFRDNIIGNDFKHTFDTGTKKIIYADWAASGRLYKPIETYISDTLGPYVANTHTETTLTGNRRIASLKIMSMPDRMICFYSLVLA